ncbi:hypothetical protein HDU91_003438 [Kappamyces sp. JEL0680]|nr:hypothetical protein HDU91_003438 [Kappamyces sp. JEL0680]
MKPVEAYGHWTDLLLPGASLVFEGGISSYKIVSRLEDCHQRLGAIEYYFEMQNPTHAVLTVSQARAMMGTDPIEICSALHKRPDAIPLNQRVVINASRGATNDYRQLIGRQLFAKSIVLLNQCYLQLFRDAECTFYSSSCPPPPGHEPGVFPILTSHPIAEWVRVKRSAKVHQPSPAL